MNARMQSARHRAERIQAAAAHVVLEAAHKRLLRRFAECEQAVKRMPASAVYFVPPIPQVVSAITLLKDKGMVCGHGKFKFERCTACGRSAKDAQAELERIQRMYE